MKKILSKIISSRLHEAREFYANINPHEYLWAWPMLVLGAIQLISGLSSAKNNQRPVMPETTGATGEATAMSRLLAQQTTDPILSGQETAIEQGRAQGIQNLKRTLKDPGQILSGVSQITAGGNRARQEALMDFGARKMNLQQSYIGQLANAAREQREAFYYNEVEKHREKAAASSALIQGGISNIAGGISEGQLAKQNKELERYVYGGNQSFNLSALEQQVYGTKINTPTIGR